MCNVTYNVMMMVGTALAARGGAAALAAHAVVRQVMSFCLACFACFNVAAQQVAALCIGKKVRNPAPRQRLLVDHTTCTKGNVHQVKAVLLRTLTLALAVSVPAAIALLVSQQPLLRLFTSDGAVLALAGTTLPFVVCCMVRPVVLCVDIPTHSPYHT